MKHWFKSIGIGFFVLSFTTLIYEILLIRILSVFMYYSFVSLVISLSLFGIGIGALLVYLFPERFNEKQITDFFCVYSISLLIPFIIICLIDIYPMYFSNIINIFHPPHNKPFQTTFYTGFIPIKTYIYLTGFFLLFSIPFIISGIISSIFISLFSEKINKLYFFDLMGASFGSLLVIVLLNYLGAPSAILFNSGLAFLCINLFVDAPNKLIKHISVLGIVTLLILTMIVSINYNAPKIKFVRGYYEPNILYSKWNAISRVLVHSGQVQMFPNRISKTYQGSIPQQYGMAINDTGYTIMVNFNNDIKKIEYVKYLINSLSYYLYENKNKKVFLIGPGGGEDILGSYSFQPVSITACEINPTVVEIVNEKFKNFTGAPYSLPNVKTVVENARSYIRYSDEKFDIISASLVYEWFEPVGGAFSLSESNLYTLEGFVDYFNHLTNDGIFSLCHLNNKSAIRFTAMAMEALQKIGAQDPSKHIFISSSYGLGVYLFKKTPFTQNELNILQNKTNELNFKILYSPNLDIKNKYNELIKTKILKNFYAKNEYDFSPAIDDKPFFNFLIKPTTFFSFDFLFNSRDFEENAVYILKEVFWLSIIMVGLLFLMPIIFSSKHKTPVLSAFPQLLYFGCIGFGYMLIEVSFMRKFNLLLSHPTLSVSLTLFPMLFAGGLGSLATNKIAGEPNNKNSKIILIILNIFILIYILFIDKWLNLIHDSQLLIRSIKSILIIIPISFFMGMPLPLGIKALKNKYPDLLPWAWSINASCSVLGAIFAFVFALNFGFNATFYIALSAYFMAFILGIFGFN